MDNITLRHSLENSNILHLVPAARAAGLSFRNGLQKKEIINELFNRGLAAKTWTVLEQSRNKPVQNPPARVNAFTDEELIEALSSVPTPAPVRPIPVNQDTPPVWTPVAPPVPVPAPIPVQSPNDPAHALANAIQALAAGAMDETRVKALAEQVALGVYEAKVSTLAPSLDKAIAQAIQNAVANLPQGTVIHLPPAPEPILLETRQHGQFGDLLLCLQQGLNVYLVGEASSGKTYAAESAAKALGKTFHAQGAVTYAHELLGYIDAHSKYVRTQFREAFEHGGLILLDEFDASSPEAALVVNAALANGFCAFPDGMVSKHKDFLCIVGANTDGSGATMQYSGRARLDGAFLDRFVQIEWKIDPHIEQAKSKAQSQWLAVVRAVREFMRQRKINDVAATVRAVDYGSTLLLAKMAPEKVLALTLKRGALVPQWEQILKLPQVQDFLTGY